MLDRNVQIIQGSILGDTSWFYASSHNQKYIKPAFLGISLFSTVKWINTSLGPSLIKTKMAAGDEICSSRQTTCACCGMYTHSDKIWKGGTGRRVVQGHSIKVSVSGIKKYCSARPGHMPLWLRWPDAIYLQRLSAVTLSPPWTNASSHYHRKLLRLTSRIGNGKSASQHS